MKLLTKEEIERKIREGTFLSFLKVGDEDECWPFMGARNQGGYGSFSSPSYQKTRNIGAHRFAYQLFVGSIPEGLFVLHRCDNPPCCNPKHLFLGTNRDNIVDSIKKGRKIPAPLKGSRHWNARLTNEQVVEIRTSYDGTIKTRLLLANKLNTTPNYILAIYMGRKWKDPNYQPDLSVLRNFVRAVARGEKSHWAKLTNVQVESIRQEYDGTSGCLARLGRKYGVRGHHIARIVRRERRKLG